MNTTQRCSRIKFFWHHLKLGTVWTDSFVLSLLKILLLLTSPVLPTPSFLNGHEWMPFLHMLTSHTRVIPFAPMVQHAGATKIPVHPTTACTSTAHMTKKVITAG